MISVIIPTHNRCDLIGRAIESVQKQSISDLEILIVSDGSTDQTKEIVGKYASADSRIKFTEYFPSKGGNVARNTGVEMANGEFVAFLDDDDEWEPNKLEKQMVLFKDSDIGLVYSGAHIIYVNEKVEYDSLPREQGDLSSKILLNNCVGSTSTVIARKALVLKVGLFDTELMALQDYDLWIRICQICKVGVVSQPLIRYWNYKGNNQVSSTIEKYEKAFDIIDKKYEAQFNSLSKPDFEKKKINEFFLLANNCMRNGDKKKARFYLKKAQKIKFSKKIFIYFLLSFTSFKMVLKLRSTR